MKKIVLLFLTLILAGCSQNERNIFPDVFIEENVCDVDEQNVIQSPQANNEGITYNAKQTASLEEDEIALKKREFLSELVDEDVDIDSILNSPTGYDYSHHQLPIRDNNLMSISTRTFSGINDQDVDVDFYYRLASSKVDHPNVGLGIMLYQAIKYKIAYPEKDNEITISSFHFSIIAGINLFKPSCLFGTLKNMPNQVIDCDGYVRFSYLLVLAAKMGIKVNIITQLGGYSNYGTEIDPKTYFTNVLNDNCFSKYGLKDHKVSDFLSYNSCDWVSYGGKQAADMYHVKTLAVEHYLDQDSNVRDYGVFFSSSNLDGVNKDGSFGHGGSQTGQIITNHKYIYLATRNFSRYASHYFAQDDASIFRYEYKKLIKNQRKIIRDSGYDSIEDDMVIYLGTEKDKVFELYFTPFDADPTEWNDDNPICKYIDKMYDSEEHINFTLNNVKGSIDYDFFTIMFTKIRDAFAKDRGYLENMKSTLAILIGLNPAFFEKLVVGKHLGVMALQTKTVHEKDMSLSYVENGERKTTLFFNSCNLHRGAFWYQTNQFLVITENESTGYDLYTSFINELYGVNFLHL